MYLIENTKCLFLFLILAIHQGEALDKISKIDESKVKDIKELVSLEQQDQTTKQAFQEILQSLKSKTSNVPSPILEEILAEISFEQFLEELIPIYDKYLSHQEVKEWLESKKTLGEENSKKTELQHKKIKINMIWGHKIAVRIQERLWDKNINFDMYDTLDDDDDDDSPKL